MVAARNLLGFALLMQARTLDDVAAQIDIEGHVPMANLLSQLREQPWVENLVFDCSMCRVWIAPKAAAGLEIMVTYGDGQFGGIPTNASLDAFDLTLFRPGTREDRPTLTTRAAIQMIRRWVGAA
jgi:hypothetical protein